MTSMPASRSARAMILAPRSWPSRPGLATTTRILPRLDAAEGGDGGDMADGRLPCTSKRPADRCDGAGSGERANDLQPPTEAVEMDRLPAFLAGDAPQLRIGVDDDGVADGA